MYAVGNPAIEYLFRVHLRLLGPRCDFTVQPRPRLNYSRTSRKRPPKMYRLSGRLPEVVAYRRWSFTRIEPQGPLPRRGLGTSTLWQMICIKLRHEQFHVVTKGLRILLVAWCTQRTQRSEDASSDRLQVVKNIGKSLTVGRKNKVAFAYRRWSFELLTVRFRRGKLLVFWIGGPLPEVVAHGGRLYTE